MKKQQIRMYLTIIIIIALFIALVLSSLAWFEANHYLESDSAVVTSAKSMEISLSIPDEQINSESYMGQTGVEYEGLDSPYCLQYRPIFIEINIDEDTEYYFICEFTNIMIEPIIETYPTKILSEYEIRDNFTWRFGVNQRQMVFNPQTGEYEEVITEKLYKNQNGFLVDDEGNPFRVFNGVNYMFNLYIYFLGEEGYSLLTETQNDIPYSYAFDYCDINYMWSTFYITINIGIRDLYTINFDSNGGSECQSIKTTGGEIIELPLPTIDDPTKIFGGWYAAPQFSGQPFENDSLVKNPSKTGFTLYARWLDKPALSFNANGFTGAQMPATQYLEPGDIPSNPGFPHEDIVAWTEEPMSYDDYMANPTPYDFNQPIYESKTLYAVWRVKHLVTLHMDTNYGGYLIVDGERYDSVYTFYVYDGQTIPDIYRPEADSAMREFKKWSLDSSASSYITAPAYDFSTAVTAPVHLYAYYGLG